MTQLDAPDAALAIGAHPDDIELSCGGTLARWAAAGTTVHHLVLTDGSKGTWDPDDDVGALVERRKDEQRAAAAALGATGEVVFLGEVDGELVASLELRAEVAAVIRELRPGVVLGHDPWQRYRLHPDHRAAGWLTVDGCVAARDPHFVPARGPHHRPDWLLLFEADEPDHVEDIADHLETKIAAALVHRSQWRTTMFIDPDDDGSQLEAFRRRVTDEALAAARHGDPASPGTTGTAGEAFRRLAL